MNKYMFNWLLNMTLTLEGDPNLLVEVDLKEMQIGSFCEIEERVI